MTIVCHLNNKICHVIVNYVPCDKNSTCAGQDNLDKAYFIAMHNYFQFVIFFVQLKWNINFLFVNMGLKALYLFLCFPTSFLYISCYCKAEVTLEPVLAYTISLRLPKWTGTKLITPVPTVFLFFLRLFLFRYTFNTN